MKMLVPLDAIAFVADCVVAVVGCAVALRDSVGSGHVRMADEILGPVYGTTTASQIDPNDLRM